MCMHLIRCPNCVACTGMSDVEAVRLAHLVAQETAKATDKKFKRKDIANSHKGLFAKASATTDDAFFERKLAGVSCRVETLRKFVMPARDAAASYSFSLLQTTCMLQYYCMLSMLTALLSRL